MNYTVGLSEDEVNAVAYALKELASKRQEQSIDWGKPELAKEAEKHRKLAERVYQSLSH